MKLTLLTSIILIFAFSCFGQSKYEYGKPSELKGLTKVHISTDSVLADYQRIVKEIEKADLGLEIVENEDAAQIWLIFRSQQTSGGVTANTVGGVTTAQENFMEFGRGGVLVKAHDPAKARIVFEFEDTRKTLIEKHPATNFAKNFLKAYKKANDAK